MSELVSIATLVNRGLLFSKTTRALGFGSSGEIDRFVFSFYARALRKIPAADRPRGSIFFLEAPSIKDALGTVGQLESYIRKIQTTSTTTWYSLKLDLKGGLKSAYRCTPADRQSLVNNQWTPQIAQQCSRKTKKVVAFAMGVSIVVFVSGDIYLETPDVIEQLPSGIPGGFQSLSWDNGEIIFQFADTDLNDRGPQGIWQLADKRLLRPKPELLMTSRLGRFLQYRLAGYSHHDQEAHLENEGRADISLHLIDARVYIVEVKWMGCSLTSLRVNQPETAIKKALAAGTPGWLTRFDDRTIDSGIRQLVRYYKTGKYCRAYLAVMDCTANGSNATLPIPTRDLDGHTEQNFRVVRAFVDPRSASKRAKKPVAAQNKKPKRALSKTR